MLLNFVSKAPRLLIVNARFNTLPGLAFMNTAGHTKRSDVR